MYFPFSAGLAPTGNWQVAILSVSVGFATAVSGGAAPGFDNSPALVRHGNALRPVAPARALPVAWTACRLVIFPVDDFDMNRNLLFGFQRLYAALGL
jgi:hypothetical protein